MDTIIQYWPDISRAIVVGVLGAVGVWLVKKVLTVLGFDLGSSFSIFNIRVGSSSGENDKARIIQVDIRFFFWTALFVAFMAFLMLPTDWSDSIVRLVFSTAIYLDIRYNACIVLSGILTFWIFINTQLENKIIKDVGGDKADPFPTFIVCIIFFMVFPIFPWMFFGIPAEINEIRNPICDETPLPLSLSREVDRRGDYVCRIDRFHRMKFCYSCSLPYKLEFREIYER